MFWGFIRLVCYPVKPVTRNTRITVDLILRLPGEGVKPEEVAGDYNNIEDEGVYAVLLYAARVLECFRD